MMTSTYLYTKMTNEGCYFNQGALNYSKDESTITTGEKATEIILKDNLSNYDYKPSDAKIEE